MSTIGSAVGGAASAWAGLQSSRASAMKDRLFAKVDSDGSGSVDKTELQGMLDHIASKTGQSAGSADDLLGKMDSDGNGSLNQDELDAAMKSLMPAPSSTMAFANRRAGGEGGGPPPSQALFSKLDADGSGSLNAEELQPLLDRIAADSGSSSSSAAGDGANAVAASASAAVFTALDTDGDGSLSESEFKTALSGSSSQEGASASASRPAPPAGGPPPGGPPPSGGASGMGTTESTDPLDTNGDGVVSAQEKAAGEINDLLKTLASAIDSDGDPSISDDEFDSFRSTLNAALQSGSASSPSSQASSSDSPGADGRPRDGFGMSALTSLVNKAYADAAANYAQAAASVSLAA